MQNSGKEEKSLLVLRKLDSLCSYCFRVWWWPGLWELVHKLCVSSALANIKLDEIWAPYSLIIPWQTFMHIPTLFLCTRFLRSSAHVCYIVLGLGQQMWWTLSSFYVDKCKHSCTPQLYFFRSFTWIEDLNIMWSWFLDLSCVLDICCENWMGEVFPMVYM